MEAKHINSIRDQYERLEGWLAPFPWSEHFHFELDKIYTRLRVVRREKKARGTTTQPDVEMAEIFRPHEECRQPKKVLIEGKPGMGKTTYCSKFAYDWASEKQKLADCALKFQLVLLLRCRDVGVDSNFWKAIEDQLLPREVEKKEKEKIFEFI